MILKDTPRPMDASNKIILNHATMSLSFMATSLYVNVIIQSTAIGFIIFYHVGNNMLNQSLSRVQNLFKKKNHKWLLVEESKNQVPHLSMPTVIHLSRTQTSQEVHIYRLLQSSMIERTGNLQFQFKETFFWIQFWRSLHKTKQTMYIFSTK